MNKIVLQQRLKEEKINKRRKKFLRETKSEKKSGPPCYTVQTYLMPRRVAWSSGLITARHPGVQGSNPTIAKFFELLLMVNDSSGNINCFMCILEPN